MTEKMASKKATCMYEHICLSSRTLLKLYMVSSRSSCFALLFHLSFMMFFHGIGGLCDIKIHIVIEASERRVEINKNKVKRPLCRKMP